MVSRTLCESPTSRSSLCAAQSSCVGKVWKTSGALLCCDQHVVPAWSRGHDADNRLHTHVIHRCRCCQKCYMTPSVGLSSTLSRLVFRVGGEEVACPQISLDAFCSLSAERLCLVRLNEISRSVLVELYPLGPSKITLCHTASVRSTVRGWFA